jgi:peptide/nickel transport system permease protein
MGLFILRRLGVMLLTALCLTFIVFFLTNLYPNLEKLAKTQGNLRMLDAEVASYLEPRGYLDPMPVKFGRWLGVVPGWVTEGTDSDGNPRVTGRCFTTNTPEEDRPTFCGVLQGDWGSSTVFKDEVSNIVSVRFGRDRQIDGHGFVGHDPDGPDRWRSGGDAGGVENGPFLVDLFYRDDGNA